MRIRIVAVRSENVLAEVTEELEKFSHLQRKFQ